MNQNKSVKWVMIVVWVIGILVWSMWNGDFFRHGNEHHQSSTYHDVASHNVVRHSSQSGSYDSTEALAPGGKLDLNEVSSYVLSISWEPGFCETNGQRPECQSENQPLALHGFWPSEPTSLSAQGINSREWQSKGCFVLNQQHDGQFCSFAKPQLDAALSQQLSSAMPGVKSCLDRHEYAKHGACFNTTAQQYFGQAVNLFNTFAKSDFGQWLTRQQGHQVSRNDIINHFADSFHTSGSSLMLLCNKGDKLMEIRMNLRAKELDSFPDSNSFQSAGRGYCGTTIAM